jgi:SAM-dependent methyltransferase
VVRFFVFMRWRRRQLFEFNDHERTPAALRDTIVESLSRMLEQHRMLDGLAPVLDDFLERAGTRSILDLGSGAAGPARILCAEMARLGMAAPSFLLTDLYPRREAWAEAKARFPGGIDFVPEPVDATKIPAALSMGRARVVINAFHHFPPALGEAILADAVRSRAPFLLAESFERDPLGFLPFVVAGPSVLLTAPLWSTQGRLEKALYTWLVPVALLAGLWDGLVSTLRVYSESELRAMVASAEAYRFEYGTFPVAPFGKGCYFLGLPT